MKTKRSFVPIRSLLGSVIFVLIVGLAAPAPIFVSGCSTPPTQRVVQVQTLKVVGETARTAVNAAANLLKQGNITVAQWQRIADFYDHKFQPAFAVAVAAVHSDLSSVASPDLVTLASQLATLVADASKSTTQ